MPPKKNKKSLTNYLIKYQDIQEYIFLVSHTTVDARWNDRCVFGTSKYDPHKHYNHRAVLREEVVIEYDYDDEQRNRELASTINKRLLEKGFSTSFWFSGGKSYHLHTHIYIPSDVDVKSYKREFIKFITKGLPRPDLNVTTPNHLIRAEFGVHEKTRRHKTLCNESPDYPRITNIDDELRPRYEEYQEYLEGLPEPTNDLIDDPDVQLLLDAEKFREYKDGVQRALFILTHVLKETMNKDEVKNYLQSWYKRVGGYGTNISKHVDYQWDKKYLVIGQLKDLMFDLKNRGGKQ